MCVCLRLCVYLRSWDEYVWVCACVCVLRAEGGDVLLLFEVGGFVLEFFFCLGVSRCVDVSASV